MKTPSVEDRIVSRLQGFTKALKEKKELTKEFNCRKVVLDLEPAPYNPKLVKQTRELLGASQAIFAQFLGVSVKAVQSWEQGTAEPNGVACRFMDEIRHDPDRWQERFMELVVPRDEKCQA